MKRVFSGLMLTLLILSIFPLVFEIQTVEASGTIYIRADGSIDPLGANITSSDNINYYFTDDNNDRFVIERDNIVIDGDGYTLRGLGTWDVLSRGIDLTGRTNVTISNLEVRAFYFGIWLEHSSSSVVSGSIITSNYYNGMRIQHSSGNTISGNTVRYNNNYGIILYNASSNALSGNNLRFNAFGVMLEYCSNNTISENNVTNTSYGIALEFSSNNTLVGNRMIENTYTYGIRLGTSSNYNVIRGNNMTANTLEGIILFDCSNNTISENSVTNTYYGVTLEYASNNTITKNELTENARVGLSLSNSSSNAIYENNMTNNDQDGIWLSDCSNNTISDNIMSGNHWDAIYLQESSYNTIQLNNMTANLDGLYFEVGSNHNVICGNNITQNIRDGFILLDSSDNHIYHNWFVNNTEQVDSQNSINTWDNGYPSGGNYWSDYTDVDNYSGPYQNVTGRDGIWDHPYVIDVENRDNYPFAREDKTPPTIIILSPQNKTYDNASIPLTFTVNEATSWIGHRLDFAINVTIFGNTSLTGLLDGPHHLIVYANDTAGNVGTSNVIYFNVDTTPPNIVAVSQKPPENNVLPEDEVKINATVTDSSGVKQVTLNYTSDNGTWITVNMTNPEGDVWNATIPSFSINTNVTYAIIAEDNVGNRITTDEMGYVYNYNVIPEFPSLILLSLFIIATLLATMVYRRKQLPKLK